jgi:flavin-dependent thymidylate synthase
MFEPETTVCELQSRLGRVGSIQAWDPWKSRRSVEDAKWWVSKIARLSHGLGEAEDFMAHFDRVVNQLKHESVMEFVPWTDPSFLSLPYASLRHRLPINDPESPNFWLPYFAESVEERGAWLSPASAFLVEAPIFVARQWMRHRSFAYLEMSRRYTKGSRVAWEFYGAGHDYLVNQPIGQDESVEVTLTSGALVKLEKGGRVSVIYSTDSFHRAAEDEYERRLSVGWPNEIARGCMPVEAMTKFWAAGFDRDWEAFLKLRDDAHAQPEIQVFAGFIRGYLKAKKEIAG